LDGYSVNRTMAAKILSQFVGFKVPRAFVTMKDLTIPYSGRDVRIVPDRSVNEIKESMIVKQFSVMFTSGFSWFMRGLIFLLSILVLYFVYLFICRACVPRGTIPTCGNVLYANWTCLRINAHLKVNNSHAIFLDDKNHEICPLIKRHECALCSTVEWYKRFMSFESICLIVLFLFLYKVMYVESEPISIAYIPHLVSSLITQFDFRSQPEVIKANMHARMMRLPSLPIDAKDAVALRTGSCIVAEYVLLEQKYFLEGAACFRPPR